MIYLTCSGLRLATEPLKPATGWIVTYYDGYIEDVFQICEHNWLEGSVKYPCLF